MQKVTHLLMFHSTHQCAYRFQGNLQGLAEEHKLPYIITMMPVLQQFSIKVELRLKEHCAVITLCTGGNGTSWSDLLRLIQQDMKQDQLAPTGRLAQHVLPSHGVCSWNLS